MPHVRVTECESESTQSPVTLSESVTVSGPPCPCLQQLRLLQSHSGWLSRGSLDKTLTMCQNGLFLNVVPESTRILSWSECRWKGGGVAVT